MHLPRVLDWKFLDVFHDWSRCGKGAVGVIHSGKKPTESLITPDWDRVVPDPQWLKGYKRHYKLVPVPGRLY